VHLLILDRGQPVLSLSKDLARLMLMSGRDARGPKKNPICVHLWLNIKIAQLLFRSYKQG
jgi:hypothetical protein